ncbi:MAG: lipid-binding SYLF domain-containing protein [Candidatus Omnitrophica bacterium]|nr:lipid-binding SYLF domain-containing protein [Candidatus Omnitrophota bacterium]
MKKILIILIVLILKQGFSAPKDKYIKRIKVAEEILEYMLTRPDVSIPVYLVKECYGIIFIRQFKGGFIIGGKGGEGIVIARDKEKGTWSAPGFIASIQASFGWQIGAQMTDLILLIMNENGLKMLTTTKVKIGTDISVAAGPDGREFESKVSPGVSILAYGRSKGFFGGLSIEGGAIFSDDKANQEFYEKKGLRLKDILFKEGFPIPKEAEKLINLLKKYEEVEILVEKKEKNKN